MSLFQSVYGVVVFSPLGQEARFSNCLCSIPFVHFIFAAACFVWLNYCYCTLWVSSYCLRRGLTRTHKYTHTRRQKTRTHNENAKLQKMCYMHQTHEQNDLLMASSKCVCVCLKSTPPQWISQFYSFCVELQQPNGSRNFYIVVYASALWQVSVAVRIVSAFELGLCAFFTITAVVLLVLLVVVVASIVVAAAINAHLASNILPNARTLTSRADWRQPARE